MSLSGPILSVEDDTDDQFLISQCIHSLGLPNQLVFFSDGQAALNYLETASEQPFLILCDINMPIMNGIEFRQYINKSDYLRQKAIPFVFLTTAANKNLVQLAYDATVQGFYQKASDYNGFQQQIKLIINYWQSCLHPNSRIG